mmetsp:Transcript_12254/g.21231  ORF Transcript_12254/g.21231 Transcript_12254/m.21231 type:complete len:93 (+) Transcript_12254:89-367(+)
MEIPNIVSSACILKILALKCIDSALILALPKTGRDWHSLAHVLISSDKLIITQTIVMNSRCFSVMSLEDVLKKSFPAASVLVSPHCATDHSR